MSTVLQICASALFLSLLEPEPELLMGSLLSLFAATSKNQKWPGWPRHVPPQWKFVNKLTRYQPITNCFSNKMYTHPSLPSNYAFFGDG